MTATAVPSAFDAFLVGKQTRVDGIVAAVDQAVGLGPGDRLLAVGSVVEGLGNRKSDLDLLLVAGSPSGIACLPGRDEEVSLAVGRCLVDVRVVAGSTVDDLMRRFDAWCRQPWRVTHAAGFTPDERTLLHRLGNSVVLRDDRRESGGSRVPAPPDLVRLKLHVARHLSRTIQVDMAGYRENGDHRTLVFAAQELLGTAVDALTAGYHLTNPAPKWRSRLLDRLPPTCGNSGARCRRQTRSPAASPDGRTVSSCSQPRVTWVRMASSAGPPSKGSTVVTSSAFRRPYVALSGTAADASGARVSRTSWRSS
jgi:hypothetical protein